MNILYFGFVRKFKYFVYLLTLQLFLGNMPVIYASTYFDFVPNTKILPFKKELKIDFKYKLDGVDEQRLRLRPMTDHGTVAIWNPEEEKWASGNEPWENMPAINDIHLVMLNMIDNTSNLWFIVQDTRLGKVFNTPKKQIQNRYVYEKYISDLNKNILGWSADSETNDKIRE